MHRLRKWTVGWGTAMLAGAFAFLAGGRIGGGAVLPLALFGALYGLAVLGLMRLFSVHRWGLCVAGLLCGPLPAAILMGPDGKAEDRFGGLLVLALFGLLVGLLEWARQSRAQERSPDA